MKGKKRANDFGLQQNLSESIQFLSFLQEDFLPKQVQKDARSKIVLDIKEVLIHACSQYKTLLELPLANFWSTVAHNPYVLRSLDSFLAFARRGHFGIVEVPASDEIVAGQDFNIDEQRYKGGLDLYYNELYRVILNVFLRLSSEPLNSSIEHSIDYAQVIYQNWLFDIPKFLDICAIYQGGNEETIRKIIQNVFKIEEGYKGDYLDLIGELTDNVIPNNLKILNRHRKREDLDAGTLKSDTEEKEKILIFLYDIMENLGFIVSLFPKTCRDELFSDKKFLMVMENTYMVLNSVRKNFRVQDEKRDVLKALAKKIGNDILHIMEIVINNAFADAFSKPSTDKIFNNKKLWTQLHHYLNQTGKTTLAKKDDEPNFKFIRKLMKHVDFATLLQKFPNGMIKEEDLENHQVVIMLQNERIEELLNRKRALENKEDTATEPSEKPSSHASPVKDSSLRSSPQKAQEKIEEIPAVKKEVAPVDKEAEGTQEAIRIIEMHIGKKDKTKGMFDEAQMKQAMLATLKYAAQNNIYDDEYDDTLEMYEEDRFRVQGDRAEEQGDSDDDAAVEGELEKDEKKGGPSTRGGKRRHLAGRADEKKEYGGQGQGDRGDRGEYKGGRGGYKGGYDREAKPYAGDGGYKGGYGRDNQQGGGYGRGESKPYAGDGGYKGGYGRDNQQGGYGRDNRDNQQGGGYYKDRNYGGDSRGGYSYEKKEETKDQGQGEGQGGAPYVKGFGAGPAGAYDPKKSNRRAYQDRKNYKQHHGGGGGQGGGGTEYVPKK